MSSPGRRANGPWALTSSAARLDPADRKEAKVQRMLRQGWQSDAWNYRDSIGELRYATNFLANCCARMRIYPACYGVGGESDEPQPLDQVAGAPDNLASVCAQAMQDLGNGRMAISGLLHSISTNKSIPGEWYLLGRGDEQTGEVNWRVCSVDELVVYDTKWMLREIPDDRDNGIVPWIDLSKDALPPVISRVWTPHPRFQLLADSPMRAMLDDCESLMILRRMIRAAGRSRLASAGMFAIPDEFSIKAPIDDDDDPEADPFFSQLTRAMETGLSDEGDASAVVPIVIRGPGDRIKQIQYFDFARTFDAESRLNRAELVGIIGTTLDLPKEIVVGIADLNHWSAWQVDDNTFRHHVEPHVIGCCDDLSGAYLRPYLAAAGIPDFWVQRSCFWYDPTELVTHPDRAKDAQTAYDAMALSGEALRAAYGFSEEDAPSVQELEVRRVMDIRALPLNLLMEYASRADPTLVVPPMTGPPQLPGIKPGGLVDVGASPAELSLDARPGASGALPAGPGATPSPSPAAVPGPPPVHEPTAGPPPITAAGSGSDSTARLSRKLAAIDSDLRARLQTAANAALLRALERAGSRVRTKVAKDESLRTKIAHRVNERVTAILGPEAVTAAGLTPGDLVDDSAWSGLRSQFMGWTQAAQEQALKTALRIGNLSEDSAAAAKAADAMAAGREAGWALLSEAMTSLSHHLLYNPDPNAAAGDWAELNPDTLVPAGTIRAALGVAGGADTHSFNLDPHTGAVATQTPVGQIGTGQTIGDLITSSGTQTKGYEWVHGPSLKPFEPHLELDGVQFENFDDPALANTGDWPDNQFYMPGDHDGCLCFPGETVVSGGQILGASRRWHDGELVEIVTANGHHLAGTPNHPILTPQGWIALGRLHVGSDVVSELIADGVARSLDPDNQQAPARIEDLFGALDGAGGRSTMSVPGSAMDFHGDGSDGQVDVVGADGLLRDRAEASDSEQLGDSFFDVGSEPAVALAGESSLDTAGCHVGARLGRRSSAPVDRLGLDRSRLALTGGPRAHLGGAETPDLDARVIEALADRPAIDAVTVGEAQLSLATQVSGDDRRVRQVGPCSSRPRDLDASQRAHVGAAAPEATLDEESLERQRADMEAERHALTTLAGNVGRDRVLSVSRRRMAGHVYNLLTRDGWYMASGIIAHNCDFMPIYMTPEE